MWIFFVLKAKVNTKLLKLKSNPVDRSIDLVCDQVAKTNGINSKERYQEKLRRTEFSEPETGKILVFLQIILRCHPKQLRLYANRVEKLNYFFYGSRNTFESSFFQNAVKGQIWIAVSVNVYIAIIRKRLHIEENLHTILQILSLTMFEKMALKQLLNTSIRPVPEVSENKQLNLFSF